MSFGHIQTNGFRDKNRISPSFTQWCKEQYNLLGEPYNLLMFMMGGINEKESKHHCVGKHMVHFWHLRNPKQQNNPPPHQEVASIAQTNETQNASEIPHKILRVLIEK